MGISPWSDSHHDNDSDDDEDNDKATAHPLARVLLVFLGLHKLVDARLHMVSGLAHLSIAVNKCGGTHVGTKRKKKNAMKKKRKCCMHLGRTDEHSLGAGESQHLVQPELISFYSFYILQSGVWSQS